MKRDGGNASESLLNNKQKRSSPSCLKLPHLSIISSPGPQFRSPQVGAETVLIRDGMNCNVNATPRVRAHRDKRTAKRRESKPRGAGAPQTWGVAAPSARLHRCPRVGGNGSHKAPPARRPADLLWDAAGLVPTRGSSTGREKGKSSHLTGAEELGEAGVCLGFPNCKQPATETTLLALRSPLAR